MSDWRSREPRGFGDSPRRDRDKLNFSNNSDEWHALFDESGKGSKGSRKNSPRKVQFEERGSDSRVPNLHLDLCNFDEPGAEDSRYVLTSPRSLEACARFGIKPVELLHKSYDEFLEEFRDLYDTNYSHDAIHEVFQEHERQRCRKLKLCREERERINREKTHEHHRDDKDTMQQTGKLSSHQHSPRGKETTTIEHKGWRPHRSGGTQRNAWEPREEIKENTRSFDSSRSTQRVVLDMFDEGRAGGKGKENRDVNKEGVVTGRPPSGKMKPQSSAKKQTVIARTYGDISDSEGSETYMRRGHEPANDWAVDIDSRSREQTSPRHVRRTSAASGASFGKGTKKMKRRTSSVDSPWAYATGPISVKDQRIIDLMMSRHKEQETGQKEKMLMDLEWDEQRKLEQDLRQARERQKSLDTYEQYRAKDARQHEVRARRHRYEQKLKRDKEDLLRSKENTLQKQLRKQEQTKRNQLHSKRLSAAERKRRQEENLWKKEEEEEMLKRMTSLNLLEKQREARRKKSVRTVNEQMKIKMRNETMKSRTETQKETLAWHRKEEELNNRQDINRKHMEALTNYEGQLTRKDDELRMQQMKKMERAQRQQEQQQKLKEQMEEWQTELQFVRQETNKRAEAVVSMNVASKQNRVRAALMSKKQEHSENYERVKQEEEARKKEIQGIISTKDERSKMVTTEKEEIKKMHREAARSSQAVRDMVREQTLRRKFKHQDGEDDGNLGEIIQLIAEDKRSTSFDKMANAAELRARVGRGPQTGHKNSSTFKFG